jgi:hypothetical protein
MKTLLTVPALCATLVCAALPTFGAAAGLCAPRDRVLAQLDTRYGESRQSIGLGSDNSVIEVFASPDTGTWTITVTLPDGTTCLVASGLAWERTDDAVQASRGEDT